jgi:8-oxo-dGTP pyrophosphatase MutT (NUDIX family)
MAKVERSAGFLIYRDNPAGAPAREYLLLDYGKYWDFPKGHLERGETDLQAAVRELTEETGLEKVEVDPDFSREIRYFFRDRKAALVRKTVVFFLAKADGSPVKISDEHVGAEYLEYPKAVKRLTYANARQLLRDAEKHFAFLDPNAVHRIASVD